MGWDGMEWDGISERNRAVARLRKSRKTRYGDKEGVVD